MEKLTKVKIQSTETLQAAINQACKNLRISPDSVSPYYGGKLIGTNLQPHLLGIPANATIRLKKSEKGFYSYVICFLFLRFSLEIASSLVRIALQANDRRYITSISASSTFWKLLLQIEKDNNINLLRQSNTVEKSGTKTVFWCEPCIVYMQREIKGIEELNTLTLRSVGLISGAHSLRFKTTQTESTLEDMESMVANGMCIFSIFC